MTAAAALAVIGSGCSTEPPQPLLRTVIADRVSLPQAARTACDAPVKLPDRDLSDREVAGHWGRDRAALRACEARRRSAVAAFGAAR